MSTAETQIGLDDLVDKAENPLKKDLVVQAENDQITDKIAQLNNPTANSSISQEIPQTNQSGGAKRKKNKSKQHHQ